MSNNIENRVVQLEMRNSSLEKGANQSIKTLDKLDKALDLKNGKRSFEDVEKAAEKCNFEPLLKAADTVTQRFSTLGIMGVRALERITDKAVDAGLALTKSLTIDQITAGYSKYEQKTASVQTLINSTGKSLEEVNGYLSRLMWFSDETSYGFTDMTQALATMTSSGGDIDKLIPMIEGVANAVAFAGKGASEFQRVMYNLNQSYSGGYLTYMDWKSVEMAGAASSQLKQVIIDTAVSLNKIKDGEVTVDNFNAKLASKFADRDVMEQAFGYFDEMTQKAYEMIGTLDEQGNEITTASRAYEILAEQYNGVSIRAAIAAQEAKTFTEAIDATKDAVSSSWMRIFESVFGNYDQQKGLWTDLANSLYDIFAAPLNAVGDIIDEAFQETPVTKLADKLEEAEVDFDAFKQKVVDVGKTLEIEFGDAADKAESFVDLLSIDGINTDIVTKVLDSFSGAREGMTSFVESEVNALELAKRLNSGEFGYGIEAMTKNLKAAGFEIESARDVYRISANDAGATIKMVGEAVAEATENTSEAFKDAYELAAGLSDEYYTKNSGWKIGWDAVRNVLGAVLDRIGAVKKAWNDVFPAPTATAIKDAIVSFHKWSETLKMGEEEGNKITAVVTRIFNVLKWGLGILGDVKDFGLTAIRLGKDLFETILNTPVVQDFFSATSKAFDAGMSKIEYWMTDLKNWIDYAGDTLMSLDWNSIMDGLRPVGRLMQRLWRVIQKAGKAAVSFGSSMLSYLAPIGKYIWDDMVVPFSDFLVKVIDSEDPIRTLKDGIVSLAKKAKDKIKSVIDAVKNGDLGTIFGDFADKIAPILEKFDEFKEKIKEVIDNAKDMAGNIDMGKIISVVTLGVILIALSKLSDAFNKISGAAGAVQNTFKSLNNIISAKFGNNFASNAKAIAGAVVAIAASIYILSTIPKDRLLEATLAVGGMMAVLAVIAGLMVFVSKKLTGKEQRKINALCKPILALSAAMVLLCVAARNASVALGTENTWKRVGTILALIGGLGLELVGLTWLMTLVSGKISVGAVVMMVVAVAILKLAQALKVLENLKLSADAKGIMGLVAVVAVIGLVISALGKTTKGGLGAIANIGIGILAAVAAIYIATLAIEKITSADMEYTWAKLRDSLAYIAGIAIGVIAAIVILSIAGKKLEAGAKAIALISAGVLLMVGAVYLMTLVVDKLASMPDNGNTANAILGVVMIGAVIAAMTWALGYAASLSNGGKGVIKIVVAVMMMTLAVGAMSLLFNLLVGMTEEMTLKQMLKAVGLMVALAAIISGMVLAVGLAAKLGEGKGVGLIIGAVAALVVLATIFVLLSSFSWGQLMPAMVAISVCVLALGGMMLMVGGAAKLAGSAKGGAAALIAGVGLLVAVALGLAVLAAYNWKSFIAPTVAIGVVLLALAWAMNLLGSAKFDLGKTLTSIAMLIVVFGGLYFIIPQVEALAKMDTMSFLANMAILVVGIGLLLAVVVGLGTLAGKSPQVLGAVALVTVALLAIAAVVGIFAASMFVLQGLNYGAMADGMLQVALPMAALGGAGITLIIGAVGVIAMAYALVLLGLAGSASANGITIFNVVLTGLLNTLSAVGNAFQNANGSIIGGLANLRDELSKSADATAETSEKLWGALGGGKLQNGVDTTGITEGISQVIPGVAATVAADAPQLGEAFSGAVTTAGESASEEATTQGEKVGTDFADSIGKSITEGLGDKFDLSSLLGGDGSGISADSLLGDIDFASLGISGGTDFANAFSGGVTANTDNVSQAGNEVGTSLNQSINESIESGAEETSNSMLTMLSNAAGMVDMDSIGNILSGNFMNSLGESFLSESGVGSETLSGNFLPLIQGMVANTDLSGAGEQMANTIAGSMATSLESNTNKLEVSDAATSLGNEANSGAKKVSTYASGSYWGEGFVNGMSAWKQRVYNTAYSIGKLAAQGVRDGGDEGSPWRTTIQSGKFLDEGLIVGIDLLGAKVQAAGQRVGLRAVQAVENGIQNGNPNGIVPVLDMSDVCDSIDDFDATYRPVIKPTLDMSGMDPAFMNMQAVVSHKSTGMSSVDAGTSGTVSPTSFNFTQNNYSPKALSRVAIYRQTKNQFSAVKDMIKR